MQLEGARSLLEEFVGSGHFLDTTMGDQFIGESPIHKIVGEGSVHKIVGEGPVQCPKCDRTFAAKGHLERHMPVHTTMVKPYSCVVCGWRFHLLHNMQRHMATHKGGSGVDNQDQMDTASLSQDVGHLTMLQDNEELSVSLVNQ